MSANLGWSLRLAIVLTGLGLTVSRSIYGEEGGMDLPQRERRSQILITRSKRAPWAPSEIPNFRVERVKHVMRAKDYVRMPQKHSSRFPLLTVHSKKDGADHQTAEAFKKKIDTNTQTYYLNSSLRNRPRASKLRKVILKMMAKRHYGLNLEHVEPDFHRTYVELSQHVANVALGTFSYLLQAEKERLTAGRSASAGGDFQLVPFIG